MALEPHWTTVFAALLTPTVAILGSYLAYRQWLLSRNKLKLDLFDRRMKVYDASRALITSILTTGRSKDEESYRFLGGAKEAKWLLNAEVAAYLEKSLYVKAIELSRLQAELEGEPQGAARSQNLAQQRVVKEWFIAQYDALDAQFAPFLRLSH